MMNDYCSSRNSSHFKNYRFVNAISSKSVIFQWGDKGWLRDYKNNDKITISFKIGVNFVPTLDNGLRRLGMGGILTKLMSWFSRASMFTHTSNFDAFCATKLTQIFETIRDFVAIFVITQFHDHMYSSLQNPPDSKQ
jgi:hypothetical protein